jgi:hypothetical protein
MPDTTISDPVIAEVEKTRNSLSTDKLDMSFGEIMSIYERNELIIDPEYQRLFRWSDEQKTSFIESILLGIPVPPIFVAENENGVWELVDGLQRVSTILSFFGSLRDSDKNKWKLMKGDFIEKIQGLDVDTAPMKLKLNIKRASCRIEIVNWNSKMDMRFELFKRLNTMGSPLTEQEVRNVIFRGTSATFNRFLTEMAQNKKFIDLISPTQRQHEERYLEELVLRFVALHKSGSNVNKIISEFLTDFMEKSINEDSLNFSELASLFNRVINVLTPFGLDIFRGVTVGNFSSSYYDGIMVGISQYIDYYENNSSQILPRINALKSDTVFRKYTGSTSNSKDRVMGRVTEAIRIFNPSVFHI